METLSSLSSPTQREEQQQNQFLHHAKQKHLIGQTCTQCSSCININTNTIPLPLSLSIISSTTTVTAAIMKKKKKLNSNNNSGIASLFHHSVVMATLLQYLRRRRRLHRHVFPLLSVLSACFLLLFAAFSLPLHHHHEHQHSVLIVYLSFSLYFFISQRRRFIHFVYLYVCALLSSG